jgi:hypothetical protein
VQKEEENFKKRLKEEWKIFGKISLVKLIPF